MAGQMKINSPVRSSPGQWGESKPILITLAASFLGVCLTYIATHVPGVVGGIEFVLIVLGLVLIVAAVRDWPFGIKTLLVVVIVEGAIRKWFMPSVTELVYFYKDVLMIATLAGYFRKRSKTPLAIKKHLKSIFLILGAFVLYTLLSMGLPGSPHPVIGVLGFKVYCLYIPLAFLMPMAFPDKPTLFRFLKWYLLIVLPVAVIGVMQFLESDPQAMLNRYAINEEAGGPVTSIAMFGTASEVYFVRITSTFSYVTGLSVYLPIMFALLLALTSLNSKQHLKRGVKALYYVALGATVVLSLMTGSRGAVLAIGLIAIVFFFFTSRRNTFRRLQQIVVVGALLYVALTTLFPQAYDAFYNRTFGTEDRMNEGWERMTGALNLPVNEASYAGLLGYGIGLTQNSVPALMKRLGMADQDNPIPVSYEGEPGRVMLELGMVGFVLYTLLRLALLLVVFRMCQMVRDSDSKTLAYAAAAALVFPLVTGGAIVTHTLNVYQWFLIGMVMALLNAERLQQRAVRPMPKLLAQAVPVHHEIAARPI
jgi:O-Antigen ligase